MNEFKNIATWQAAFAEFLAVFILVFVAVGATGIATAFGEKSGSADVLLMGMANGAAITVGIAAFFRISGAHINPAVTIAAVVTGNSCAARAAIYIVFQLAGAVAASAFMRIVFDIPRSRRSRDQSGAFEYSGRARSRSCPDVHTGTGRIRNSCRFTSQSFARAIRNRRSRCD